MIDFISSKADETERKKKIRLGRLKPERRMEYRSSGTEMKIRFFRRLTALILLTVLLCGAAWAEEDSLQVEFFMNKNRFTSPEEINVAIRITNNGETAVGPIRLLDPQLRQVEEFGEHILEPGDKTVWAGGYMLTQEDLDAGYVSFTLQYAKETDGIIYREKMKVVSRSIIYEYDWVWEMREDGAWIFYYRGSEPEPVMPSELGGQPVVRIDQKVFFQNQTLERLSIPEGVITIGDLAFSEAPALKSVTIPEGVSRIGHYAFTDDPALESVSIPESVTNFGDELFDGSPNVVLTVKPGSPAEQYCLDEGLSYRYPEE